MSRKDKKLIVEYIFPEFPQYKFSKKYKTEKARDAGVKALIRNGKQILKTGAASDTAHRPT